MALDSEQRGVAHDMGAGVLLTFIVLGAASLPPPLALPDRAGRADRGGSRSGRLSAWRRVQRGP